MYINVMYITPFTWYGTSFFDCSSSFPLHYSLHFQLPLLIRPSKMLAALLAVNACHR